jgi:hypothetical protein
MFGIILNYLRTDILEDISIEKHLKGFIGLYNSSFIKYCDSNIGLFSFASYKVIALPTIATAIVFALTRS